MIRDRIKQGVRKAALRFFGMEWDASERPVDDRRGATGSTYDPTVIPRVVDGSGDTPGPKHAEDIGRTWVAAQLVSGVAPFLIDLRPPAECAAGLIRGAYVLPGRLIERHLELLPAREMRVTVYDQLGSDDSAAVAAWLREQGWPLARRLRGGYAEWIEHGEPVEVPQAPEGGRFVLGQMVQLRADGRRGYVLRSTSGPEGASHTVWFDDGTTVGPLGEDALAP